MLVVLMIQELPTTDIKQACFHRPSPASKVTTETQKLFAYSSSTASKNWTIYSSKHSNSLKSASRMSSIVRYEMRILDIKKLTKLCLF